MHRNMRLEKRLLGWNVTHVWPNSDGYDVSKITVNLFKDFIEGKLFGGK